MTDYGRCWLRGFLKIRSLASKQQEMSPMAININENETAFCSGASEINKDIRAARIICRLLKKAAAVPAIALKF